MREQIVTAVVAVIFAALHLFALLQGVSNLLVLPAYYEQLGIAEFTPWWLLIVGLLAPPVVYLGAVLLGRGRTLTHRVALLAVSLATVNALVLSAGALAPILLALQAG